jgi:putative oxidoreductase
MRETIASWEGYTRSLLRIILAFTFSLHGYRHLFGFFHVTSGRRATIPMAIDALPAMFGSLEILGGALLFLGLLTRPVAALLSLELVAAYLYAALPRGPWPIRNGGNEVLLYLLVFLYLAVAGGGIWSIDHLIANRTNRSRSEIPAGTPVRT